MTSTSNIRPCDLCTGLKDSAAILKDTEGKYRQALADVLNELASADLPPEDLMASMIDAVKRHAGEGVQYDLAGQYIDALTQYTEILTHDFGYPMTDSFVFALTKYINPMALKGQNLGLAANYAEITNLVMYLDHQSF